MKTDTLWVLVMRICLYVENVLYHQDIGTFLCRGGGRCVCVCVLYVNKKLL